MKNNTPESGLQRELKERHITLMALGSAIGVGLFLGSASAIELAGPGILLAYILSGIVMFFIMRALGEMAIHKPVSGSFSQYAREYLGSLPGFITGWNYWFLWVVTCMAEITAVGIYMGFWFPDVPRWIWVLAALVIMALVNFLTVKAYGELEFWFALIKIITIIFMIVSGFGMILFGIGNGGLATGIHNLWSHGGFLPHGIKGILLSLQMVAFAFLGIEMIGVTAGEAKNPKKTIAKAVDATFWRILIFYVGALFVIMSIYPWNELGTKGSPFVMTFDKLGIPAAAGIINFVVLTAALSSCNGGLFSTARMLFNLAENGEAPKRFAKLNKNGVPGFAVFVTAIVLLIGVVLNYIVPAKVFAWVTSISTFGAIWTWVVILLSQMKFRSSLQKSKGLLDYRLPLYPFSSIFSIVFLIGIAAAMALSPDTRIALIVGPLWIIILTAFFYGKGYHKKAQLTKVNTLSSLRLRLAEEDNQADPKRIR